MFLAKKLSKQDPNAPSALADEHAEALAQYEATRADIIDRAATRQANLRAHRAEIDAELAQHDSVIAHIKAS